MRSVTTPIRVGLSGTGYIARGLRDVLAGMPERYRITSILTRRPLPSLASQPGATRMTRCVETFVDNCDVVVECSGTVDGARRVVEAALQRDLPTITMNAEFQVTLGSAFAGAPLLSEAQGDQPGCLAALDEEARLMGFKPLVYGSQKGFLDHHPTLENMRIWAARQGTSVSATTAFTDGTKVQIEQAMVADCLGAGITRRGLSGPRVDSLSEAAQILGAQAKALTYPIADYALCPDGRGEVFIVATHPSPPAHLSYYKMGSGDLYYLSRPYHLGHFEIPVTIDRMVQGRGPLMSMPVAPTHSVLAVAKRDIARGNHIKRAIGSFEIRGEAVLRAHYPDHVPIGLLENCTVTQPISAGQTLCWSDVELHNTASVALWENTLKSPRPLVMSL